MAVARPFVPPVQEQDENYEMHGDECYEDGVYYEDSDGEPMAETDWHWWQMEYCLSALNTRYADDPHIYVAGDNFLYFEKGNNSAVVSPDCYVIFGAEKRKRRIYKVWSEGGRTPDVVFEITSKKTRKEDFETKMQIYEQVLHVAEYFLFDPEAKFLRPRLQGYRLVNGKYERLPLANNRLHSEQLNLDLIIESELMRMHDPVTGKNLLTSQETFDLAIQEGQRAELAAQRAAEERQRAEQEARRADAAEREVARLLAEMEALRRK